MITRPRLLHLTRSIVSLPSTSFHEHAVRRHLAQHAATLGLPWAFDRWGNLHVRYRRGGGRFHCAFVAHMDHPGFVVTRARGRHAQARWFGGVLRPYFRAGRVALHTAEGTVRGRVVATRIGGPRRRVQWIRMHTAVPVPAGTLGTWDLPAFERRGDRIHARAADDLVGCALLAGLLESLAKAKPKAHVTVIYTRAEEVGLFGASAVARAGLLAADVPVLALETSKTLPCAQLGAGVVLRVGDRLRCYDPALEAWVHQVAQGLARQRRGFRFQRCLMDGGVCEASVFGAAGYRATGLALPLRNYHNMGARSIAAEEVDARDMMAALALLDALATAPRARGALARALQPITFGTPWLEAERLLRTSAAAPLTGAWDPPRRERDGRHGQ